MASGKYARTLSCTSNKEATLADSPDVVEADLSSFGGIYKAVVEQLKVNGAEGKIHRLSGLAHDLGMDSLDGVEMVMSFEDMSSAALGEKLSIPDEDAEGLRFPLQVAIYLADRLGVPVPDNRRAEMEVRRKEIEDFTAKRIPKLTHYGGNAGIEEVEADKVETPA